MAPFSKTLALAIFAAAALSACASSTSPAPPVPVAGSDTSALAGRWEGEYSSEATGRKGSIVFELKSGDRVARGDVLMVPKGGESSIPQVLNISFVSSSGDVVTGTMDVYEDPGCACDVQTTFVGRVAGDTVEGTFTTTPTAGGPIATGHWKITRKKK